MGLLSTKSNNFFVPRANPRMIFRGLKFLRAPVITPALIKGITPSETNSLWTARSLRSMRSGSSQNHKPKNAPPTASAASAVSHRSPCSTAGTLPDSPSVISPPVALTVSLPCDSCYLIEESDQVFPDQVIDDQHGGKHQRHVRVVRCPMS